MCIRDSYKGVVPVGFGTDAIGGVVNIVTNKQPGKWFMDASYSYGSFNTHKSYVRFGQTFKNGFMYEVNAFQNFSDNDYYVDTYVREFEIKAVSYTHLKPGFPRQIDCISIRFRHFRKLLFFHSTHKRRRIEVEA